MLRTSILLWGALPSLYGAPLPQTCTFLTGEIQGAAQLNETHAASPEECCAHCFAYPGCVSFTFAVDSNTCFLKDNFFGLQEAADRVSGRFTESRTLTTRACSDPELAATLPFCDSARSVAERVDDLVGRLTLEQKAPIITARESPKGGVPSLGLPEYDWGANCIHGVQSRCGDKCPTTFPNPNAQGAAWNRTLWRDMAAVTGQELRALWLADVGENHLNNLPHLGLDCWSPNININRDPRWGRALETPGEDPYLNGQYGVWHTQGLQEGEDARYLQAIVTLKHFAAYSLEDNAGVGGINRHNFNAEVSRFDLADTYFPAFKEAVREGHAKGVMCSYNAVNGVPSCGNDFLLQTVLRDAWGFDGYVTSDSGAIQNIYADHHYLNVTEAEAVALAVKAGCDVDSGTPYTSSLAAAVNTKLISEEEVDALLRRTFKLKFDLGLFDPIEDQPYWHYSVNATVATETSLQLAHLATRQGLVLLQNVDGALPLKAGLSLAVIGPHVDAQQALTGNYIGQQCPDKWGSFDCIETPFDAFSKLNAGGNTVKATGCDVSGTSTAGFDEATTVAAAADAVVLCLGLDTESVEREGHDRESLDLPGVQLKLLQAVVAAAAGKPVVVVLLNGGAVALDWAHDETNGVGGIIESFYPGKHGAAAIADVLFGAYNPGGKMPFTTYKSSFVNESDFTDMSMTNAPGRTYRYYTGEVLWPFGFGLSYTTFSFAFAAFPSRSSLALSHASGQNATFSVAVTNTGERDGDEVVEAYFRADNVSITSPGHFAQRQLFDFERLHLAAGSTSTVAFVVSPRSFALVNSRGDLVVAPGSYSLWFTNGADQTLHAEFSVLGDEIVVEPFPGSS